MSSERLRQSVVHALEYGGLLPELLQCIFHYVYLFARQHDDVCTKVLNDKKSTKKVLHGQHNASPLTEGHSWSTQHKNYYNTSMCQRVAAVRVLPMVTYALLVLFARSD